MTISTTRFTITSDAYTAVAQGTANASIRPLTTGALRLVAGAALPVPGATAFAPVNRREDFQNLDTETDLLFLRAEGEDVAVVVLTW